MYHSVLRMNLVLIRQSNLGWLLQKKKLQNRLSKIETEISDLEKKIINDDAEIAENFKLLHENEQFFKSYQQKKSKVEELMTLWEEVQGQIESL